MLNALSNMTMEIWIVAGCMAIAYIGWGCEYYKGKAKDKKVHKAYKEGYERGVKDTKAEYEFREEMKRWIA